MLAIEELLNFIHDLTYNSTTANYIIDSNLLNYDDTNITNYKSNGSSSFTNSTIPLYYILKNFVGPLSNYLYIMSDRYIKDAIVQSDNNSSLVLILTVISIAVTFLTAFAIIPILHKIERSKEKVLMIYTELKKEQIE